MSEYCDGCGEWDVPDGLIACADDDCDLEACGDCIGDDGRCSICSEQDDDE